MRTRIVTYSPIIGIGLIVFLTIVLTVSVAFNVALSLAVSELNQETADLVTLLRTRVKHCLNSNTGRRS